MKPSFAVTLGDPDGIGPEIVSKALKDRPLSRLANWKIFGSSSHQKRGPQKSGQMCFASLKEAIREIKKGNCQGLVTAPISKERIQRAGFRFPGHTEYLAHCFSIKKTVMMFVAPRLKVALTTIHIPLKKVVSELTVSKIVQTIQLTFASLQRDFGIKKPRIAVCSLNPHAGEKGIFGEEEKKIIAPAIRQARKMKMNASGPYPADSIFHQALQGKFDAVIAHYHDQGLIPVKTLSFHEGVNMTLGLPIIRTSPDQGCAFDIAGKGIADPSSMKAAMKLAFEVWRRRNGSH